MNNDEVKKEEGEFYECPEHGKWPAKPVKYGGITSYNFVCPVCAKEIEERREYMESEKCEKWEGKVIMEICSRGETRKFPATAWVITEKATGKCMDKGINLEKGTSDEDIAWIQAAEREAKKNIKMTLVA